MAQVTLGHVIFAGISLLVEGLSPTRTRRGATIVSTASLTGFNPTPEESASFFNQLAFAWVVPMLKRAQRKVLDQADMWAIPARLSTRVNGERLQKQWIREMDEQPESPSFAKVFIRTVLSRYAPLLVVKTLDTAVAFLQPTFIGYFVSYVKARGTPTAYPLSDGITIAIVYLVLNLLTTITDTYVGLRVAQLNLAIKSGISHLIYAKTLRLCSHRESTNLGEILQHTQADADSLVTPLGFFLAMYSAPIVFVVALVLLYAQVGWLCVLPPLIIVGSSPLLARISANMMHHRMQTMQHAGQRTKLASDSIAHMLGLKLYGWTGTMAARILAARELELKHRQRGLRVWALQMGLGEAVPAFATFAVFVVLALTRGQALSEAQVFTTLAIVSMLDHPISAIMYGWPPFVQAYAAAKRVGDFLGQEERKDYVQRYAPTDGQTELDDDEGRPLLETVGSALPWAIRILDGKFSFTNDPLRLALSVPRALTLARGSRTAVVGPVGSGKSALLACMLGEIDCLGGSVTLRAKGVAYVAQSTWISHATLQSNVLFGLPLDQAKYDAVIGACALRADVAGFPDGHLQVIGDKGRQLSGGQKARLALARAVYAVLMGAADVVLMDDPLSSVDAHVEREIFDALFAPKSGLLSDAAVTVVMVTNGLNRLAAFDGVLLINGGMVAEYGSYAELIDKEGGVVRGMVDEYMAKRVGSGKDTDEATIVDQQDAQEGAGEAQEQSSVAAPPVAAVAAPTSEAKQSGSVGMRVYHSYLSHCGAGFFAVYVFLVGLGQTMGIIVTFWLGYAATFATTPSNVGYWALVYSGLVLVLVALGVVTPYFGFGIVGLRAARATQVKIVKAVFAAPMSFFNATPAGQILNRLVNDQQAVDSRLPSLMYMFLGQLLGLIGTIVTIAIATPWFLVLVLPASLLFQLVQTIYLTASREVERISAVLTSPVLQHFSESVDGITTIRGFCHADRFMDEAVKSLDRAAVGEYNSAALAGWRSLVQDVLGKVLVSGLTFMTVLTPTASATLVGVALLQSSSILFQLSGTISNLASIENALVSVERINEYTELEPERNPPGAHKVDGSWPQRGEIQFEAFATKYRDELPPVLNGIDLKIEGGSRVAIVGRTGSGKTSTVLSLFRILEATAGSIQIDGINISDIDLDTLRTRLTILPQDPTIFSASVRDNLDPLGLASDADLWRALDASTLGNHVRTLEDGLDAPLTPTSLSAGQSQLLVLARAMLRKSKVLVLDEATAKLDGASDAVVQRAIRTEFADHTVITIAHRIDTVLDYDTVVVLSDGKVVEVGAPAELLKRSEGGLFYALAKESQLV
ncbi:P-loop containing nucleoside triphosphate hydrolase protein [Catenaria anguillulae PL171]|uniref:p-loop containing nucleoside triphosphate hydrolase protein n=1 Tax=Catenaria anguillulae PL171 TaxID=765915 RepID=A0A1Y2HT22_9FUNG|nr:P-loop containing nucleoside triphosphate hydrolase protein [Catenaria anguillulae PL171]